MSWKAIEDKEGSRTFVLVAEPGEEAMQCLQKLANNEELAAAQLTALGAFSSATVGWFDRTSKQYRRIEVEEQCEVLALVGDIALGKDGSPVVHAHAVLGLSNGETRGGHLLRGEVWPTLEVIVRESPAELRKTDHPELGLALIDLANSGSG